MLPTLYDGRTTHARLVLDRIGADYGVTRAGAADPAVGAVRRGAGGRAHAASASARASKGAEAYRAVAATLADRLRPA